MSADNGIYVLKTPAANGADQEFRVIYASAIENIYWSDTELDLEQLVRYFGRAKVFTNISDALLEAYRLYAAQGGYVEYGIQILDHSDYRIVASPGLSALPMQSALPALQ